MRMFASAAHEATFERDGCVVIEGFAPRGIDEVERKFQETSDDVQPGFQHSLQSRPGVAQDIGSFVTDRYAEQLRRLLPDFHPVLSTFVSKAPDGPSVVGAHQDWSFVDEQASRSLNVWIPLCDTTLDNGALGVVKRSHKLPLRIRGTNLPDSVSMSPEDASQRACLFPMRAGDALVFEHRAVHWSPANLSGSTRAAAQISLIPDDARLVHYVGAEKDDEVLELSVDTDFFYRHTPGAPVDADTFEHRSVPFDAKRFGREDMDNLYVTRRVRMRAKYWSRRVLRRR